MDAPNISPSYCILDVSSQEVTITSGDPSATIKYTLTGDDPDSDSATYTGAFSVTSSTVVKAIAIDSEVSSAITTSYIQFDDSTSSVTREGLTTWLKSDNGVNTTSSQVSEWIDVSGNGNNAVQTNTSYQPTFTTNAINGLPAISFSGSSQFLQLPTGYSDFTEGLSIFVALKPTNVTVEFARIINLGNNANNDNGIILCEISDSSYALYQCDSAGNLSDVLSNDFTLNSYQLLEAISDSSSLATLFTDSVESAENAEMKAIGNVSRTGNYIGKDTGSFGLFYEGEIAEIIIYQREISDLERRGVEVYFSGRYSLPGRAPTISPSTAIVSAVPQAITISADDPDATIFYTTTGDDPNPGNEYTGPFNIEASTTIKAVAVRGGVSTPVATAMIQLDPTTAIVPRVNVAIWLRSDFGVDTSSTNVSEWLDLSGLGNNAIQNTTGNQPTLVANAINDLPAVTFNGSGQYLQIPENIADFSNGMSVFVVLKPTGFPETFSRIFQLGNNSNASALVLCEVTNSSYGFYIFDSSQNSSSIVSGLFTQNEVQIIQTISDGTSQAALYTNGILGASSNSMNAIENVARVGNCISKDTSGGSLYFEGQIAEILIYYSELSESSRASVQLYLAQRYGLSGSVAPPLITLPGGALSTPSQVVICGPLNAEIRITTDGTEPNLDSSLYLGPVLISFTQTLKAVTVISGFMSSVVSESYELDSILYPAPDPDNTTPLSINLDLPTVAQ